MYIYIYISLSGSTLPSGRPSQLLPRGAYMYNDNANKVYYPEP